MSDNVRDDFDAFASSHGPNTATDDVLYRSQVLGWMRKAWLAAKEKYEPRWIPEPEMDSYEGWCWIVYKGRVTEAYRDHNYSYRFGKHSQNCYLTECITLAMKWEYPDAPSTQGGGE